MQLLAIGLAASLLIGPAPSSDAPTPDPSPAEDALPDVDGAAGDAALPDVDEPVGVEPQPEPEPEPLPEPEPELTPEPPPPEPASEPPTSTAPPPVVRDRLGCDGSKTCKRMSITGIVVGTLGLAAVGTGIALVVKRDEVIPESPTFVTSTRPAGIVTLTIGVGVTLTSALMLVASHRGYKQRSTARVEPLVNGLRF